MSETVDSAEARAILQTLFVTEADIHPDPEHGRLIVRVHRAPNPVTDRHHERLFALLNETETHYPGTPLQMIYEII